MQKSDVHGFTSSQSALPRQQKTAAVCTQVRVAGSHVSAVHELESAQSPSSAQQSAVGVFLQFPAASHASVVQGSPSSQSVACAQQPATGGVTHTVLTHAMPMHREGLMQSESTAQQREIGFELGRWLDREPPLG
jgi:hypothetical protein